MRTVRMSCTCRPVSAKRAGSGKRKSRNKSTRKYGKMPKALAAYWRKKRAGSKRKKR